MSMTNRDLRFESFSGLKDYIVEKLEIPEEKRLAVLGCMNIKTSAGATESLDGELGDQWESLTNGEGECSKVVFVEFVRCVRLNLFNRELVWKVIPAQ